MARFVNPVELPHLSRDDPHGVMFAAKSNGDPLSNLWRCYLKPFYPTHQLPFSLLPTGLQHTARLSVKLVHYARLYVLVLDVVVPSRRVLALYLDVIGQVPKFALVRRPYVVVRVPFPFLVPVALVLVPRWFRVPVKSFFSGEQV